MTDTQTPMFDMPVDYATVKVEHPTGRAWTKLSRDIDKVLDLCRCGGVGGVDEHLTATPEFFTEGVNYGIGISVTTCRACRPMIERLIDGVYGRHYDKPRGR